MNFRGILPPIILIIFVVLGVAFFVAYLILRRISLEKKYFYAFAGASGMLTLVTLFPALSYDLEMYRGALTLLGKGYITATGALGGYIFGLNLPRQS
jgi:ABC-type arginine transport system permease subunit